MTRAQIGFYESLDERPVAILYQHADGYPTGRHGLVGKLLDICNPLKQARGFYSAEYLAARTLVALMARHDIEIGDLNCVTGFGISSELHADTRFYYALTDDGIHVYDARTLTDTDLNRLEQVKSMFFTAWTAGEERRALEKEISRTEQSLGKLKLELESLKRR